MLVREVPFGILIIYFNKILVRGDGLSTTFDNKIPFAQIGSVVNDKKYFYAIPTDIINLPDDLPLQDCYVLSNDLF